MVFVPIPGTISPNHEMVRHRKRHTKIVSVPIPGTISPNWQTAGFRKITSFCPHSGDYISKLSLLKNQHLYPLSFRPHSGDYISKSGNTGVSICYSKHFRPHSGDYISKWSTKVTYGFLKRISVPIPGTISPNPRGMVRRSGAGTFISVPIPGTISPNKATEIERLYGYNFRPHSGDYISKYKAFDVDGSEELFPSPFRGLYLQI